MLLSPREFQLWRNQLVSLVVTVARRSDGLTLIPWQGGRPMVWDVTVATTLADTYVSASAALAGAAAETAATRKSVKYASTPICQLRTCSNQLLLRRWAQWTCRLWIFWTIWAVKSVQYLVTTERDTSSFSVCRSFCSVIMLFCCTEVSFRVTAWTSSHSSMILTLFVFNPRDLYYRGWNFKKIIIIITTTNTTTNQLDYIGYHSNLRYTLHNVSVTVICLKLHTLSTVVGSSCHDDLVSCWISDYNDIVTWQY